MVATGASTSGSVQCRVLLTSVQWEQIKLHVGQLFDVSPSRSLSFQGLVDQALTEWGKGKQSPAPPSFTLFIYQPQPPVTFLSAMVGTAAVSSTRPGSACRNSDQGDAPAEGNQYASKTELLEWINGLLQLQLSRWVSRVPCCAGTPLLQRQRHAS
jgi:hypothetical protein